MTPDEMREVFGEPISIYTDGQAVEDGILVEAGQHDRVTRPVWSWLVERLPEGAQPPDRWPVEMLGWFGSRDREVRALAAAVGLIDAHRQQATRVYEQNIGGGIFVLVALYGPDAGISEVVAGQEAETGAFTGDYGTRRLWLLPNELGGVTLMFPEDY